MATTTTYPAIRDNYITLLQAATPSLLPEYSFHRVPRHLDLREWAVDVGSAAFRAFAIVRGDAPLDEPPHQDPSAFERSEVATLVIAYPVLPALYGTDDLNSLEHLIRTDLTLIRRVLWTNNYIAGQSLGWLDPKEPERQEFTWFQPIEIQLQYTESQSLSL